MSKSSRPSNSRPPPPPPPADTSPLSSTIPIKKRKVRPLGRHRPSPPTDPVPSVPSSSSSVHPTAPQPSSPPAEPRTEIPTSCDGIIEYIQGRRRLGLIKALTRDLEDLFKKCHPDDKHNMCLYGLPSGKWKVSSAPASVPLDFSESMVGIPCGRDKMNKKKWAADVALRCDMWLVALAVYFGSKIGLDNDGRGKLFNKINEKRTILEVVEKVMKTGANTTKVVEKVMNTGANTTKDAMRNGANTTKKAMRNGANNITDISATNSREVQSEGKGKNTEGIEQSDNNICRACNKAESPINWVNCDGCDGWFHCECVGITSTQAENMPLFLCPTCSKPVKVQESAHHP